MRIVQRPPLFSAVRRQRVQEFQARGLLTQRLSPSVFDLPSRFTQPHVFSQRLQRLVLDGRCAFHAAGSGCGCARRSSVRRRCNAT